jgi:heme/copper-type cytochrome/quinol oxidase subunit 2
MPTFVYGLIALVVFGSLAAVVWSYRDVANRHAGKARASAAAQGRVDGEH